MSVSNTLDNVVVTTKVKTAVLGDESTKSRDIAFVTRKGEVRLSDIEGVRSVSDETNIEK